MLDCWTHSVVSFNHYDNPCCLVAQWCPGSGKNKTKQSKKNKKTTTCQCRRVRRPGFDPWARKVPWRSEWHPTPVFLPGEFHGLGRLEGYVHRSQTVGQRDLRTTGIFKIFKHQKGTGNDHLEELVPEKLGRQHQLGGALRKPDTGTFIFNFKEV